MKFVALCSTIVLMLFAQAGFAQDKPFKEGSIWSVTFVKVKPGMFDTYIRDLSGNRRPLMEQAKKEGLILQEKMLAGESAGREDFDLILMVEYKNWAAFDGLSDKFRALAQVLADRRRSAADAHVAPAGSLLRLLERRVNAVGDEVEGRVRFHRQRRPRMVRQHENRHVIRRFLAPPAAP